MSAPSRSLDRMLSRLELSDWILVGYLVGMVAVMGYNKATSTADRPQREDQRRAWLTEEHLQRLENGETVVVERWHGHDLVLDGTLLLDLRDYEEGGQ